MPYPVYSIVVIEETVGNVTELQTFTFKTVAEAKVAYNDAINADKRAFLYEKPRPTSFRRKDSQPFHLKHLTQDSYYININTLCHKNFHFL